ncbi:MAG: DUF3426 domain-containing protein [Comamonadaceae bacterium]|nr:MAG: DUF3426 domain-containing protein [Comamonadaceae bacterium]
MSLITRCPACGTMFKVVPDQLRISEGWVRCGHCAEVFDASAHMQQDQAAASAAPPTPAPAAAAAPVHDQAHAHASVDVPAPDSQAPASTFSDSQLDRNLYQLLAEEPMPQPLAGEGPVPAPSRPAPLQPASRPAQSQPFEDSLTDLEASLPDPALDDVSFVREARRKAFWRKPATRGVLTLVVLVLLAVLGLQVAYHERDRISAMEPRARPLLQALCSRFQCSVQPLRQIESIVIDSSAFNKLRADTYRLSFTVKNNAPLALAMPAIELSLTDSADQPVLRRVLMPADLGAASPNASPVLAAGGEWSGTFPINVSGGSSRVVGYRLLAFYP